MRGSATVCFLLFSINLIQTQSLRELLDKARVNHPLLKAKRLESVAMEDQVRYVKSSAIPSIDAGYQVNYATYNNITGMATPDILVMKASEEIKPGKNVVASYN
jgi:outer membrane protein